MLWKRRIPHGYVRGYFVKHKEWQPHAEGEEIVLGLFHPQQGTTAGEIAIRWRALRPDASPVPRLDAFSDAWRALFNLPELADLPTLGEAPTAEEVIAFLSRHGYRDMTQYEMPEWVVTMGKALDDHAAKEKHFPA